MAESGKAQKPMPVRLKLRVLPRPHEILSLTLEEYEERVKFIREKGYHFSEHEEQEIKAALRKINNRMYAAHSRLQKKNRMTFLENRVDELELENEHLRKRIRIFEEDAQFYRLPSRLQEMPIKREEEENEASSSLLFTPYSGSLSSFEETLSF